MKKTRQILILFFILVTFLTGQGCATRQDSGLYLRMDCLQYDSLDEINAAFASLFSTRTSLKWKYAAKMVSAGKRQFYICDVLPIPGAAISYIYIFEKNENNIWRLRALLPSIKRPFPDINIVVDGGIMGVVCDGRYIVKF